MTQQTRSLTAGRISKLSNAERVFDSPMKNNNLQSQSHT